MSAMLPFSQFSIQISRLLLIKSTGIYRRDENNKMN